MPKWQSHLGPDALGRQQYHEWHVIFRGPGTDFVLGATLGGFTKLNALESWHTCPAPDYIRMAAQAINETPNKVRVQLPDGESPP